MTLDVSALDSYREFMGEEADDFIREVVTSFLENAPTLLETMETALAQDDVASFVRAAHTLKSNSATVGATLLSSLSKSLEEKGKIEPLSTLKEKFLATREEFARVQPLLEEMLA